MIVFAGLAPHNPLLLTAGAETENTHDAVLALGALLMQAEPDVVVLITEHAPHIGNSFSLTVAPTIHASFKQFGIAQSKEYRIDTTLSAAIAHAARAQHIPLQQLHNEELDYGSAVLAQLFQLEKPLVIIGTSRATILDHAACGEMIQDALQHTNLRVAILIGGDGSHNHSADTPAGFSEHAHIFDTEFSELLAQRSLAALAHMSERFSDVDECISHATALGFGIIKKFPPDTHLLANEIVHGVGLFSALLFLG